MVTHQSVREVGATGRCKLSGVGSVFCCFCSGPVAVAHLSSAHF